LVNQNNPYIGNDRSSAKTEQALDAALTDIPVNRELLSRKLEDITKISGGLSAAVLHAIQSYTWSLVPYELVRVPDEDTPVKLPLVQLAVRKKDQILISGKLFSQLDPKNQVALIFHEAIYALLKPVAAGADWGWREEDKWQPAFDARRNNQYLFRANANYDGLVKTARRFGDPKHLFLPVTGPFGSMPEIQGNQYSVNPSAEVWVKEAGYLDRLVLEDLSSENKATKEAVEWTCHSMEGQPVINLILKIQGRVVVLTPGALNDEATYLAWSIDPVTAPLKEKRFVVNGPQSCQAKLIEQLKQLNAY
ncbi:MAG: hypothetical protein ACXWP1_02960, partial [Bdellovibrionota bacterium]